MVIPNQNLIWRLQLGMRLVKMLFFFSFSLYLHLPLVESLFLLENLFLSVSRRGSEKNLEIYQRKVLLDLRE